MVDKAVEIAERRKKSVGPMYYEKIDSLVDTYARKLVENMKEKGTSTSIRKESELTYSKDEVRVPIHLKMTLTITEATEYSNIGMNKIDTMLISVDNCWLGLKKQSLCDILYNYIGLLFLI